MTTIHLDPAVADGLLRSLGWRVLGNDERGWQFVKPGRVARADGGAFGRDYLWERDDALTLALRELARCRWRVVDLLDVATAVRVGNSEPDVLEEMAEHVLSGAAADTDDEDGGER